MTLMAITIAERELEKRRAPSHFSFFNFFVLVGATIWTHQEICDLLYSGLLFCDSLHDSPKLISKGIIYQKAKKKCLSKCPLHPPGEKR